MNEVRAVDPKNNNSNNYYYKASASLEPSLASSSSSSLSCDDDSEGGRLKIMRTIAPASDASEPPLDNDAEPPSKSRLPKVAEARPDADGTEEGDDEEKPKKKRTWKKPKDKPKRPLSAYNLFFQHEREKLIRSNNNSQCNADEEEEPVDKNLFNRNLFPLNGLNYNSNPNQNNNPLKRRHRKTHGKIGFADLARTISRKWSCIDPDTKEIFEREAAREKRQYKLALAKWERDQKLKLSGKLKVADETASEEDFNIHNNNNNVNNNMAFLPGARRISLDHSTGSSCTGSSAAHARSEAFAAAMANGAHQRELAVLLAAFQRGQRTFGLPTHAPPQQQQPTLQQQRPSMPPPPPPQPQVEFFPRLFPNSDELAATVFQRSEPPNQHARYAAAAAAAASSSAQLPPPMNPAAPRTVSFRHEGPQPAGLRGAAAAFAANCFMQGRFDVPQSSNRLHELAMYSDLFGRSPYTVLGDAGGGTLVVATDDLAMHNFMNSLHHAQMYNGY